MSNNDMICLTCSLQDLWNTDMIVMVCLRDERCVMTKIKVEDLLNLKETIAASLFTGVTYPWEVLSKLSNYIIELGQTLAEGDYDQVGQDVWVSKSATIAPTASITGPTIIGHHAEVRHCAYIRGSVIVGESAIVGNSTELKNVVLFNRVQVPHFNYVGDSILGYQSHIGAGGITSNQKSDKSAILVQADGARLETGLTKLGTILGDHVEVGSNSVLNPGSVVGRGTTVYPLSMVRGVIPAQSIYKKQGDLVEKSVRG